jgi:membrane protease YdiL (CAAX protease family)
MESLFRWLAGCKRRFLVEPMRQAEAEARAWRGTGDEVPFDWHTPVVFVTAAISLVLIEYLAKGGHHRLAVYLDAVGLHALAASLLAAMDDSATREFNRLAFFAIGCMAGYVLLPLLVIKLVFRQRLAYYGLKLNGMFRDMWVYGAMLACVGPAVVAVSFTEPFLAKYPFYRLGPGEPLWPRFILWEVLYALQFVALEFFFRGFLVHGTRRRLGYYSIFAMMVPYCMIHFGKPLLETFAAIVAGIVLGIMSLKNRSIWMGALLHITVAWGMDVLALWQKLRT